uniref:Uncharacterized protein n=1 Tax=Glossina pallidipes TaxID=7398 RepID=A0A1B0A267_GLOPL
MTPPTYLQSLLMALKSSNDASDIELSLNDTELRGVKDRRESLRNDEMFENRFASNALCFVTSKTFSPPDRVISEITRAELQQSGGCLTKENYVRGAFYKPKIYLTQIDGLKDGFSSAHTAFKWNYVPDDGCEVVNFP